MVWNIQFKRRGIQLNYLDGTYRGLLCLRSRKDLFIDINVLHMDARHFNPKLEWFYLQKPN